MHNPEPVLENVKHIIFWDFEIQIVDQISVRWPDLVNKKGNLPNSWLSRSNGSLGKTEGKRKER